jgi:hypothetical protein
MRQILIIIMLLPLIAQSQINKSARQFAGERVGEYVSTKLFKDLAYKPLSFGQITERHEKDLDIAWTIEHTFEITDTQFIADRRMPVVKSYRFMFYLDRQMRVKRAETYQVY